MNIQKLTQLLLDCSSIDAYVPEIEGAAEEMMMGAATPVQMAALLTALSARGESADAVAVFARVMRARAVPFARPPGAVLDTCGTGGDHSGTFNISTAAAFVAAGTGLKVAKHGNRSMTSKCGSADVLAHLGVAVNCEPALMERALNEIGICFLFAQCYHHSMKHVAAVRRELGFRTIFNLLGPLSNPAGASHQLLGVFGHAQARLVAEVLNKLGTEGALVVHGSDGLDELTTTGPSYTFTVRNGSVTEAVLNPSALGIKTVSREALLGGDVQENADILLQVLSGAESAKADIVILNAGAAVCAAGQADSIEEGMDTARKSISSGAALAKLEALKALTASAQKEQA